MKNSFLQANAAVYLDSMVISTKVNNLKELNINTWAYAFPEKIYLCFSKLFGLAIAKNSQNKEAAFCIQMAYK